MGATNHTTNYNLPQFVGSDKPTWLGDFNSAMNTIDTQMKANDTLANTAKTTADTALINSSTAETTANNAQTKADTADTTANSALNKALQNESDVSNLKTSITYNTSEIVVGTWIDGKPIYRKVIIGTLDGTFVESGYFFTWINTGITNIDNITSKELSVKTTEKISFEGSENLKLDYILTGGFANNVQIGAKSGSIPADSPVIITLEYTKTSDNV